MPEKDHGIVAGHQVGSRVPEKKVVAKPKVYVPDAEAEKEAREKAEEEAEKKQEKILKTPEGALDALVAKMGPPHYDYHKYEPEVEALRDAL